MWEFMQALWGGFVLVMMVIYVLLVVVFWSYMQLLIVLGVILFGIVGVVLGYILLGYDFFFISLMGVIVLFGVVVNDVLIMIDYVNKKCQE